MIGRNVWLGIAAGLFFAGLGMGYVVFGYGNSYQMMHQNPQAFRNMMGSNPQFAGQYMGYMMQDPQLRDQMYSHMFENHDFMYGMMQNQNFQNQYMGPWMMQNPGYLYNQNSTAVYRQGVGSGMMGSGQMGHDMMGSGMMGGYGSSQTYNSVDIDEADKRIHAELHGATVDISKNMLTFDSSNIDLVFFAMMDDDAAKTLGHEPPAEAHAEDDVFVINGLVNPTLVVKAGSSMRINLINLDDDMAHNLVVGTMNPPYSYMPMQGMMTNSGSFLSFMPVLPQEDEHNGIAYESSTTVRLDNPGVYWYLCTYPGHAEDGMYGKIIVQ